MAKKCIIVSCFHESLDISRSYAVLSYLKSKGFDSKLLYSSFSHSLRSERIIEDSDCIAIKTISYNKSVSLARIFSNFLFSIKSGLKIFTYRPDLVYVCMPPNLAGTISVMVSKIVGCQVICDVVDVWPEALIGTSLNSKAWFPSSILRPLGRLGRVALRFADYCLLECELYRESIDSGPVRTRVLPLVKPAHEPSDRQSKNFSIAYLGSISNVYDFDVFLEIVRQVSLARPVEVHLLGEGPGKTRLLSRLAALEVRVFNYEPSFDNQYKTDCLGGCWFGFNGYHPTNYIGLSYKAVDYLSLGLPLLNNLKGELAEMVRENRAGFNFVSSNTVELIEKLKNISAVDVCRLRANAYEAFNANYSYDVLKDTLDTVLNDLGVDAR